MNLRTIDANMSSGIGNEMVKLPDDFENYISHIYLIKKKKSHYNRGCKSFAFFFLFSSSFLFNYPKKVCILFALEARSMNPLLFHINQ